MINVKYLIYLCAWNQATNNLNKLYNRSATYYVEKAVCIKLREMDGSQLKEDLNENH